MPGIARRAVAVAVTAALTLTVLVVGSGAVLARLDLVRFATVLSGSMEPGIPTGAVIAGTPLPSEQVAVGDVVMFVPPHPYGTPGDRPVVHRVTRVTVDDGVLEVSTQGDANSNPDAWTLDAGRTTFYEYRGQSVVLGTLVRAAPGDSRPFIWTAPVLLLMFHALRRIWQHGPAHTPRHAGRRPAGQAAPHGAA